MRKECARYDGYENYRSRGVVGTAVAPRCTRHRNTAVTTPIVDRSGNEYDAQKVPFQERQPLRTGYRLTLSPWRRVVQRHEVIAAAGLVFLRPLVSGHAVLEALFEVALVAVDFAWHMIT